MTVKERIKVFCKHEQITVSCFEQKIGVANGYVNSISKSVGIDKLYKIVEIFPNLNLEWLLVGRGEMLAASSALDSEEIRMLKERLDALESRLEREEAKTEAPLRKCCG